jgi:phage terminase large subunit
LTKIIEYAPKLSILGEVERRVKIIVGGRGSTKSTFVADYCAAGMSAGQIWCCAREYQNTIEESVHRLLVDEIERLDLPGFTYDKSHVYHASGGRNFYRGLSRNPGGVKSSLTGVHGVWIEEGETLSKDTLRQLSASLRRSAKDAQAIINGQVMPEPEIWITLNRGSSKDPISQKWLKRAERDLAKTGIYMDDTLLVVQINYDEIPKEWFMASGLEVERLDDEKNLTPAEYDHKWHGAYNDTVPDAIIRPDWFDACVDAHIKLNFKPSGIQVVSFDPSDTGGDDKGLAYRHGNVFLDIQARPFGDVNDGCDWAIDYALNVKNLDHFVWDSDGLGAALRRDINQAFDGTKITAHAFYGGSVVDRPNEIYEKGETENSKSNKETFFNLRSQKYADLRDRCHKTYKAVVRGEYINPEELISFSSKIDQLDLVRAEMCSIPRKYANTGKFQIKSKKEMKADGIDSQNTSDSAMMSLKDFKTVKEWGKLDYKKRVAL